MENVLADRVAIITGAGRGLGRAFALEMAAQGAKVVVNDNGCDLAGGNSRNSPADAVVEEIRAAGGQAIASYDDVSVPEACDRIIEAALDAFGHLDILVNNAAIVSFDLLVDTPDKDWDEIIRVGLNGAFYMTKRAAKIFMDRKYGRIINMVSDAAGGYAKEGAYASAKGGLITLTQTAAREMQQWGITCNAIKPSAWTRIPIEAGLDKFAAEAAQSADAEERELAERIALCMSHRPEQVAPLVVYLASEISSAINGCVFGCGGKRISLSTIEAPRAVFSETDWTVERIAQIVPRALVSNAAPLSMASASEGYVYYGL